MSISERIAQLRKAREKMLHYLDNVVRVREDWHGVADAAMDLREIDAEIAGLEYAIKMYGSD